jgi:serine/threonine protein kinase
VNIRARVYCASTASDLFAIRPPYDLPQLFIADAYDERSDTSTNSNSDESAVKDSNMASNVSAMTDGKYIAIRTAGAGSCGTVVFCVAAPSPTVPPQLVVVKVPREMRRQALATEIKALQRLHSLPTSNMSQHFPQLVAFDPETSTEGACWLALEPIYGFSLAQLLCCVQNGLFFSETRSVPVIPRVLVLSVARDLVKAVRWMHDVAGLAHRDIYDANVMLCLGQEKGKWEMPHVVLIDFDNAVSASEDVKGFDRAFVYELLYSLGNAERVSRGDGDAEDKWWSDLMDCFYANRDQDLKDKVLEFKEFMGRFGEGMETGLGNVSGEDERQVKELVEAVMQGEVEWPEQKEIERVVKRWVEEH